MRDLMWISSRLLHFYLLFNSMLYTLLLFVCSCFFLMPFCSEKFIEPFTYKICFSFNETSHSSLRLVNDVFYHSMKNKIIFSPASFWIYVILLMCTFCCVFMGLSGHNRLTLNTMWIASCLRDDHSFKFIDSIIS